MDVAGSDERVNTRPLGLLERPRRNLDVSSIRAGQCCNLHPRILTTDCVHGLEVAFGRDRETGFEDVDAELHEFVRHLQN